MGQRYFNPLLRKSSFSSRRGSSSVQLVGSCLIISSGREPLGSVRAGQVTISGRNLETASECLPCSSLFGHLSISPALTPAHPSLPAVGNSRSTRFRPGIPPPRKSEHRNRVRTAPVPAAGWKPRDAVSGGRRQPRTEGRTVQPLPDSASPSSPALSRRAALRPQPRRYGAPTRTGAARGLMHGARSLPRGPQGRCSSDLTLLDFVLFHFIYLCYLLFCYSVSIYFLSFHFSLSLFFFTFPYNPLLFFFQASFSTQVVT